MLLTVANLNAIKAGEISLVFRRWRKPTVKTGGTLRTAIGVLAIREVRIVSRDEVNARDAKQAGFGSLDELLALLDEHAGTIYRIHVEFAGADPRIGLRESSSFSDAEFKQISDKLSRMDKAAVDAWTLRVLRVILKYPFTAAVELAPKVGMTRAVFKPNVRKLKNLGLTISHDPGYELSPRGKAVLARLESTK